MSAPASRPLGPLSTIALVAASMIGSGVFTTSGFAVADLGSRSLVLLAWLTGGALAILGALSYGALARRVPRSGGEYALLSATVHPAAGFAAGWVSLLAGFTAPIAVAALGMEAYLGAAAPSLEARGWMPRGAIASLAICGAGLLHGTSVRAGAHVQDAAVALKLLGIGAFLVIACLAIGLGGEMPAPGGDGIAAARGPATFALSVVWVSFAYSGWNAAVYTASEVRDAPSALPRALLVGTSIVTVAYVAMNAAFLFAAPLQTLAGRADVAAVAARALGGPLLERAMSALVALALLTSISSAVMAGPRVVAAMAADGHLPRCLAHRAGAPTAGVALQCALAMGAVWASELRALLGYAGFTLGLCAAATVAGLIRIRLREGAERCPVPGWPFVPAIFVLGTLAISLLAALSAPGVVAVSAATMLAGASLYWVRRGARGSAVRAPSEAPASSEGMQGPGAPVDPPPAGAR